MVQVPTSGAERSAWKEAAVTTRLQPVDLAMYAEKQPMYAVEQPTADHLAA